MNGTRLADASKHNTTSTTTDKPTVGIRSQHTLNLQPAQQHRFAARLTDYDDRGTRRGGSGTCSVATLVGFAVE